MLIGLFIADVVDTYGLIEICLMARHCYSETNDYNIEHKTVF